MIKNEYDWFSENTEKCSDYQKYFHEDVDLVRRVLTGEYISLKNDLQNFDGVK